MLALVSSALLFATARWGLKSAKNPELKEVVWRLRRVAIFTLIGAALLIIKGFHDGKTLHKYEWAIRKDRHSSHPQPPQPHNSTRNLSSLEENWSTLVNAVTEQTLSIKKSWGLVDERKPIDPHHRKDPDFEVPSVLLNTAEGALVETSQLDPSLTAAQSFARRSEYDETTTQNDDEDEEFAEEAQDDEEESPREGDEDEVNEEQDM